MNRRNFLQSAAGLAAVGLMPLRTHAQQHKGKIKITDVKCMIVPAKPMWLEDPVPPGNAEAMARVTHAVDIPICTGENLYTRDGFRRLIELQGCDIVHIDIPKSGGLMEAKRIHDLADNYYIWTAAHNPASPVGTIASCHAAASMREFPRPRARPLYRLEAGSRRSRRADFRSGILQDSRQAGLRDRDQSRRREGASGAWRVVVGVSPIGGLRER